jgi:hypothetical protein
MAILSARAKIRAVAVAVGLAAAAVVCHAEPAELEYSVKAAFLLNFTKFVQWPPAAFDNPQSPLTICVLGMDPFESALDQVVEGEAASGRKVAVQRLRRAPAAKSCQVVYIASAEKEWRRSLHEFGPGVLTVGEGEDFLAAGGMIAFVLEKRRVRFDVNQAAMTAAGLAASSRMLGVARTVQK